MKQELYYELRTKYSNLFENGCSIDCDDGWYGIIDTLSSCINAHIEETEKSIKWAEKNNVASDIIPVDNTRYVKIKEKFGTLRIYAVGTDEYINGMIRLTEVMSGRTCEICGATGKIRNTS